MTNQQSTTSGAHAAPKAGAKEWLGLGVLVLPLVIVSMDTSVLYFAVPFLSADLLPTTDQQLWIFDIYGFILAGLLVTMGSLADRIGRRKLLIIGILGFGLASVGAAYAESANQLILARALLGIGGATLMPSTRALILNIFRDEKERTAAVGIWTAGTGLGVAIGPVVSGLLLDHFWWGSVFLLNIPAMVLMLVLAPILLPESKDPNPGRFDLPSAVLSLGAILPVIYAMQTLAADKFNLGSGIALGAGILVGVLFICRQRALETPMIDTKLLLSRGFGGSAAINTTAMFAIVGFGIFSTQYLQSVLGLSALSAGLWCLIPSFAVAVAGPVAAVLSQKMHRAYVISAGFTISIFGYAFVLLTKFDSPLWVLLTGVGVANVGLMMAMVLVGDLALSTVPKAKAGSASALLETTQQFGGAAGMAVLGSVGFAVYRNGLADKLPTDLPANVAQHAREALADAVAVANQLPDGVRDTVVRIARVAFTDGMHAAAITAGGVMIFGAILSAVVLGKLPKEIEAPDDEDTDGAASIPQQNGDRSPVGHH
ncbi:DHA2 family multidrug resistance protein-like MFS transporter [Kitasatospora gansuensis]|uniref:DHA2 family multidrug resistance protein-like MFS transporter n=1 Tax=Kitasatospora gansuensis TaxID=258050 RepID=A0A7W7S926_9ACTN|nr:MFS transporter [Kitasatospora gansuensis]MBB4946120.1 DHA2 family multidrug resistance protein-like MFS transporter [Kitasatospora gansuensis]